MKNQCEEKNGTTKDIPIDIKIYEICLTENKHHLNGQIILFDRGKDHKSYVSVMVYSGDKDIDDDTFHISSEEVTCLNRNADYKKWTANHTKNKQEWEFVEIKNRRDLFKCTTENCYDNYRVYNNYISYRLKGVSIKQGDGTGTGGNTGGN
jgi:hypothetical protein